jgi:hypothetical protein
MLRLFAILIIVWSAIVAIFLTLATAMQDSDTLETYTPFIACRDNGTAYSITDEWAKRTPESDRYCSK